MAVTVSQTLAHLRCDRVGREIELVEERIYPTDERVPDTGLDTYRIRAQSCSLGLECYVIGFPCKWAGFNPEHDPFAG